MRPPATLGQRTFGGMLWMSSGVIGQVLVQIVVLSVLARRIPPGDFGVAAAALVVLNLSVALADTGLGAAIVQRKDLRTDHVRVALTASVLLGLVVWGLLIVWAPAVAGIFSIPRLEPVLRVMGAAFFLRSLTIGDHLLQRDLDFRRLAIAELGAFVVGYAGVSISLALTGAGVWAIVWGHVAWAGLRTTILWSIRPHAWMPSLARRPVGELVRFGAGLTAAQFASVVASQGDNFVVGRWLGASALGLYGRAYQLMAMPAILFGQVANKVLFPAMAAVQDDQLRLRKAYATAVAAVAILTLPASALLAVTSREVILVALGEDWLPLLSAFNVLVFTMLFRTSFMISDCLALARGDVYRRASRKWAYAGLVVLGSLVGQRWGLSGVAAGVALALAANFLLMAQLSLSVIGMSWRRFVAAHAPAATLSVLVAAVAWPVATALRGTGVPAFVVLLGTVGAAGVLTIVALRSAPAWAPGMKAIAELVGQVRTVVGTGPARVVFDRLTGRPPHPMEERVET